MTLRNNSPASLFSQYTSYSSSVCNHSPQHFLVSSTEVSRTAGTESTSKAIRPVLKQLEINAGFKESEHVATAGQLEKGQHKHTSHTRTHTQPHIFIYIHIQGKWLAFKNRVTFRLSSALFLQPQMDPHQGILAE